MANRNDDELLLTVEEAMQLLKCGRTKIYSLGDAGRLELVKFDRATRITRSSVERVLAGILNNPRPRS